MADWMDFREYARTRVIKKSDRILEFGPLNRPTVRKSDYPNTYYADVRNSDDIKKLYTGNDYLESTGVYVDTDTIVDIDYVIQDTYKETFKNEKKFDVIILSHVIEHIPDIVSFFTDVASILKKDGKMIVIYPDARYCFDHFRNGTTFIDAYDVYTGSKRSSKRVFDFVFNVVHENDPSLFWNSLTQEQLLPQNDFKDTLRAYDRSKKGELPDDTHFWPFADYQFVKFLYDLDRAGLSNFEISEFYETQENTQEFMIILRPKSSKDIDRKTYTSLLSKLHPVSKEIEYRHKNAELSNEITSITTDMQGLKLEYSKILNELSAVYSSKRWRYATKLAEAKNKIRRGRTND